MASVFRVPDTTFRGVALMSDLYIVEDLIEYLKRFRSSGKRYGRQGQIAHLTKMLKTKMGERTRAELVAVRDMLEINVYGDAKTAQMALNRLARYLPMTWRLPR